MQIGGIAANQYASCIGMCAIVFVYCIVTHAKHSTLNPGVWLFGLAKYKVVLYWSGLQAPNTRDLWMKCKSFELETQKDMPRVRTGDGVWCGKVVFVDLGAGNKNLKLSNALCSAVSSLKYWVKDDWVWIGRSRLLTFETIDYNIVSDLYKLSVDDARMRIRFKWEHIWVLFTGI